MENRGSNAWIWLGAAILLVLYFSRSDVGRPAPEFALKGAYGGDYSLASFHGRPVLLAFWTTSCGICRHELPLLDQFRTEAGQSGVEIAGINIGDVEGARSVMRPLHVLNLVDTDGAAARAYKVSGVPRLVLIGADGKIKQTHAGFTDAEELRAWLR